MWIGEKFFHWGSSVPTFVTIGRTFLAAELASGKHDSREKPSMRDTNVAKIWFQQRQKRVWCKTRNGTAFYAVVAQHSRETFVSLSAGLELDGVPAEAFALLLRYLFENGQRLRSPILAAGGEDGVDERDRSGIRGPERG